MIQERTGRMFAEGIGSGFALTAHQGAIEGPAICKRGGMDTTRVRMDLRTFRVIPNDLNHWVEGQGLKGGAGAPAATERRRGEQL